MKPAVLHILAYTFLFVSAASCKKSDTVTGTPAKSNTILLTQASWKIQSVGIDQDKNGVAETDVTSSVPACQLDNTYTFKTDSTGIMDEAALKCAAGDPQTTNFTWGFKNNETVLTGTFSFSKGDATILSMNDTNLVVTYDDNLGTAITYHFLVTLKH
jgi:hypothetical protein